MSDDGGSSTSKVSIRSNVRRISKTSKRSPISSTVTMKSTPSSGNALWRLSNTASEECIVKQGGQMRGEEGCFMRMFHQFSRYSFSTL
ncbi:hypothetical protein VNO77_39057 [Canavalia gladiata]|uniref:Uncharacterized protein n=1 Tax=Canavalia gladiata TaxID=3824 RepID=A0AAN9K9R5_CANGL